jgi:hypothetical protein
MSAAEIIGEQRGGCHIEGYSTSGTSASQGDAARVMTNTSILQPGKTSGFRGHIERGAMTATP